VRLDAADINVDGKRVAITPGMAVNAEIITGDRRVIGTPAPSNAGGVLYAASAS